MEALDPSLKCEKCSSTLEYRQEKRIQGLYCDSCGWVVVTSYFSEAESDPAAYAVVVYGVASPELSQIRAVADMAGVNFLEAKRLLTQETFQAFKGKRAKAQEAFQRLQAVGLSSELIVAPSPRHRRIKMQGLSTVPGSVGLSCL
jgi:hypothetical protein